MVKLINAMTGTEMWVEDSRVEEYLKLGHKKPKERAAKKGKPLQKTDVPEGGQPQETDAPEGEQPQEADAPEGELPQEADAPENEPGE